METSTAERAREALALLAENADVFAIDRPLNFFGAVAEAESWHNAPLEKHQAIDAANALAALNSWSSGIASTGWPADEELLKIFPLLSHHISLCYLMLDNDERVEINRKITERIEAAISAGRLNLTAREKAELHCIVTYTILEPNLSWDFLVALQDEARKGMIEGTQVSLGKPDLPRLWRATDASETASEYFEAVLGPLPFDLRPSTTELARQQPELYRALKSYCYDQKQRGGGPPTEIGRATAISQILPIGHAQRSATDDWAELPKRRRGRPRKSPTKTNP